MNQITLTLAHFAEQHATIETLEARVVGLLEANNNLVQANRDLRAELAARRKGDVTVKLEVDASEIRREVTSSLTLNDFWGPEIAVNRVRPSWLRDTDEIRVHWGSGTLSVPNAWRPAQIKDDPADVFAWAYAWSIRLPADHPYYVATSKGFEYWPGGDAAPEDWNGGAFLFRCGIVATILDCIQVSWRHDASASHDGSRHIIGYRKKGAEA